MDIYQDVEVELYEENVGNLNYSTPTESRSSSPDRFMPVLSSQEPTQRRLEEIPFVAIDPRPDPEELSHAPTSQVPRIHDSCHITSPEGSTTKVGRIRPAQSRCSVSMKEPQILAIISKYVSCKTFVVVNCESKCGQHGMRCNIT